MCHPLIRETPSDKGYKKLDLTLHIQSLLAKVDLRHRFICEDPISILVLQSSLMIEKSHIMRADVIVNLRLVQNSRHRV